MFYILPWQFEGMNTSLHFSRHFLFLIGCWVFAFTCSINKWVKYRNSVILHRLSIFHISFTQRLTLRIPWTSVQIHPRSSKQISSYFELSKKRTYSILCVIGCSNPLKRWEMKTTCRVASTKVHLRDHYLWT